MADLFTKITELVSGSKALEFFGAGNKKRKKYVQVQQKGKTVQKAGERQGKGNQTGRKRELTPEEKARIRKARAEKAKLEQAALEKEKTGKKQGEPIVRSVKPEPEVKAEPETVKPEPEVKAEPETVKPEPEVRAEPETVKPEPEVKAETETVKPEPEEMKQETKAAEKAVQTPRYDKWNQNKAVLTGVFTSEFEFSLDRKGARIYTAEFAVKRTSGVEDKVQISASEEMIDVNGTYTGRRATIEGQFRSRNSRMTDKTLILYVFAKNIELLGQGEMAMDENNVSLHGYVCKPPVYRKTPAGKTICDVLLGVNRTYRKTDYIPCIFWKDNAEYVKDCEVGTELELEGRIQSREYLKKIGEKEEKMTAYELSVNVVEKRK